MKITNAEKDKLVAIMASNIAGGILANGGYETVDFGKKINSESTHALAYEAVCVADSILTSIDKFYGR
jgi:hypothetical protein